MFCFFVWYLPVIKKLSALFLVYRIIKVSFRLWETRQLWDIISGPSLKSASSGQHPESSNQSPASRVQRPESSVQRPVSRVQRPESSVQSPASNSYVQSPGIPVCPFLEYEISKIVSNILSLESFYSNWISVFTEVFWSMFQLQGKLKKHFMVTWLDLNLKN